MLMKRSLEIRRKSNRLRTALLAIKEIGLHRPLAFDFERAAGLEAECLAQCKAGRGGDVDLARQAIAFHAFGGVYGVAPDVVDKFAGAEHAGNQRTGVEADSQLEPLADDPAGGLDGIEHRERHLRNRGGVVASLLRKTARHRSGALQLGSRRCLSFAAEHRRIFISLTAGRGEFPPH